MLKFSKNGREGLINHRKSGCIMYVEFERVLKMLKMSFTCKKPFLIQPGNGLQKAQEMAAS